jgi:3-isopropylmalate/(R)-2-methylmalate dehydratase large subunit
MEERMTVCNMSIECGARAGLIAPDNITFDYLRNRPMAPQGEAFEKAVAKWRTLRSDDNASYDRKLTIDISHLTPMVTWGTNPGQAIELKNAIPILDHLSPDERASAEQALRYTKLQSGQPIEGTPIQWAFLGSCTNGRISDLRIAANILKGRKISPEVTFYIVPGSEKVEAEAEAEGLDKIFIEAGADWRRPGCSMCLGMNEDKVPAGQRCISTSNRNFVGRQGTGSITHLASPATVAASAITGTITSPESFLK